jgi:kumamolisin
MINMAHHTYIKYPRAVASAPWRVPQLCASYSWPTGLNGGGVIGIIELGGGWIWNDVGKFFGGLSQPVPKIGDFSVDGTAMNNGDITDSASGEVALDIQVAGASYFAATGKPATIRMYWAPNTLDAIAQGIAKAAADGCDVCSISWGSNEKSWGQTAALQLEAAAIAATQSGMIIFAASGDNDAGDGGVGENVDLPASAPHVIGCGGTMRPHNSSVSNPEKVWNTNPHNVDGEGSGGGYSTIFQMPSWMSGAPGVMRMVPDVTANADPMTGYHIILGGVDYVFGGTSAVAPLFAGLFGAFGRKLGFVTPKLWANHLAFNDIIVGNNGFYRALPGPDPVSGLGSPAGSRLAGLFI